MGTVGQMVGVAWCVKLRHDNTHYRALEGKMNAHREAQATAIKILNESVRTGALLRPGTCDLCGASSDDGANIYGHHWRGYDYPIDVWWVCSRCNNLLRDRHDSSLTQEQARDFVAGGRFALLKGASISIQDEIALSEGARALSHAAKAPNTRRAYRFGWSDFEDWCRRFHRNPLPATAATIAEYL